MRSGTSNLSTSSRLRSPAFQRIFALLAIISLLLPQIMAIQPAFAAGGAYTFKWTAADPAVNIAPYLPTYKKQPPSSLACPTLSGSVGRAADPLKDAVAYAAPAISSNLDSVTSLEPKEMALGQIVPF